VSFSAVVLSVCVCVCVRVSFSDTHLIALLPLYLSNQIQFTSAILTAGYYKDALVQCSTVSLTLTLTLTLVDLQNSGLAHRRSDAMLFVTVQLSCL